MAPIEVFISYSHRDEALRKKLGTHLSLLKRQRIIDEWHDRRIGAGQEWVGAIDDHLNSAAVVLLLVSADFLASDYCYDVEMKRALERHDTGALRVVPVILRPVDWQGAPFARLPALPKDGRPIAARRDKNAALAEVAAAVRTLVGEMSNKAATSIANATSAPGRPPRRGSPRARQQGKITKYDAFLSHSHGDANSVERLACILEDHYNFRVWLDKWVLTPGQLWQQEISRALSQVPVCVACIGSSTPKGWFLQEIQRALNIQTRNDNFSVIPVVLPGGHKATVDDFLELRTWVDFSGGFDSLEGMHLLVSGIRRIPPGRSPVRVEAQVPGPLVMQLKTLANLRGLGIIDEDIHKQFQVRMLENYLRVEGAGDVTL